MVRADQFVLAAAHEIQQGVEELAHIGGANEILQPQIANVAPQINPKIFVVEDSEVGLAAMEQAIAPGMKGEHLKAVSVLSLEFRLYAPLHFFGGVVGVGKSKNLVGARTALTDQMGNTLREDSRLSGAGAGQNQHRAMDVLNGFPLAFVGLNLRS